MRDAGAEGRPRGGSPVSLPVALLFVALAGFWGVLGLTRGVEHLTSDQHLNLVLVLKGLDPSLFPADLIFSGPDIAGQYIPLYIGYLRWAYTTFGDLAAGYRLLVVPLNLLYLVGAYLALFHFTRVRWIAALLATFVSLPLAVPLAGEIFGVGPVQVITARSLFTAAFPWLFWGFVTWPDRPLRLVGLFAGIGLLANLHPVSGLFVAPMLILAYLVERRWAGAAWLWGGAMGLATLLGALPILLGQLQRVAAQDAGAARAGAGLMQALVLDRMGYLLYPPHTLAWLPRPAVDALTLCLGLGPVLALGWAWRSGKPAAWRLVRMGAALALAYLMYPQAVPLSLALVVVGLLPQADAESRPLRLTAGFALAVFWVSVGGVVGLQALFALFDRPVLFADMLRGARFAPFACTLLLAASLRAVAWARLPVWARAGCALFLALAIGWGARDVARTYLRTRGDAAAADLVALAEWARAESDPGASFLFDSPAFRVLARRSLLFATKDGTAVIYHNQDRAAVWMERQAALRAAGSDPAALRAVGERFGADYVVVAARDLAPGEPTARLRYRNRTYAVLALQTPDPPRLGAAGSR
jgi:hypothetical protein